MKRNWYRVSSILLGGLLAGLAVGCSGGSIEDDAQEYADTLNEAQTLVCECDDDPETCRAENLVSQTDIDCLKGVASDNPAEVRPTLSCAQVAATKYLNCVKPLACTESTAFLGCVFTLAGELQECPQPPASVDAMIDACIASIM